jgi:hypothetical protein
MGVFVVTDGETVVVVDSVVDGEDVVVDDDSSLI